MTHSQETRVQHVHTRTVAMTLRQAGGMLDALAGPHSPWPSDRWWPLVLDNDLEPGSTGGHGPVSYRVSSWMPGRSVVFRFRRPFCGFHRLDLERAARGVTWTHTLVLLDPPWLIRTLALPQHDQLVEDLFDNVEHATRYGTRPAPRRPLSARLRAYRRAVDAAGGWSLPVKPLGC